VGLRAQHHPHLVFVADMPFHRLYAPVTPPYPINECPFIDKHNATCCRIFKPHNRCSTMAIISLVYGSVTTDRLVREVPTPVSGHGVDDLLEYCYLVNYW